MATVNINPLPEPLRQHATRWSPPRFLPSPPSIFSGGQPTGADRALAYELWKALDPLSKRWYVGWNQGAREFVGLPLTEADIESMSPES